MERVNRKRVIVILVHAFVGWALCGAIMGIGMSVTSIETTLVIHAIGAPVFFAAISFHYFKKVNYTTPLQTAMTFLAFVIFMDFFVVALLIERSFEMFASVLGTWIPFALIFLSTHLTGLVIKKRMQTHSASP